ncbi:hypothetical protein PPSIR1_23714 [Plesiocystis pacifica SIR-1]|uniref:Uncharacterized protein n=1 Tax=Plesiocystis pacifica SIR-1 TaxID=391625 RepID=A6G7Y5_9BACT|nr:hypothetical protein PPSIR1_23714 [Plesiocystis pacifica SIR-1]
MLLLAPLVLLLTLLTPLVLLALLTPLVLLALLLVALLALLTPLALLTLVMAAGLLAPLALLTLLTLLTLLVIAAGLLPPLALLVVALLLLVVALLLLVVALLLLAPLPLLVTLLLLLALLSPLTLLVVALLALLLLAPLTLLALLVVALLLLTPLALLALLVVALLAPLSLLVLLPLALLVVALLPAATDLAGDGARGSRLAERVDLIGRGHLRRARLHGHLGSRRRQLLAGERDLDLHVADVDLVLQGDGRAALDALTVDEGPVGRLQVGDVEVAVLTDLEDRMTARDAALGEHEVVGRDAANGHLGLVDGFDARRLALGRDPDLHERSWGPEDDPARAVVQQLSHSSADPQLEPCVGLIQSAKNPRSAAFGSP